ncbi:MAG: type I methionyl aminopeptidase [Deltaproteobacteria bacterium]|nr:type I methionyl aminopeptidase [Deltaproteobacteria bacterium]
MSVELKTEAEISIMRRANMLVHDTLQILAQMAAPGVATNDLDRRAREMLAQHNAQPAFLGYPSSSRSVAPFPGVICASRNEEIVHGIPNDEPLRAGDILSIDFGTCLDGYYGDSAITVAIGEIGAEAKRLMDVTKQSLEDAISQCVEGNRIGDVSYAVQSRAEKAGYGVVREFVGHGIGRNMHEAPQVPNFGRPNQGRVLKAGMVIAIEPMITEGSFETKILGDGWTAVTKDGKLAAHFEHSVAITKRGPFVLSRP